MSQELELQAIKEARAKKFQTLGVLPTFSQEEVVQAQGASVHGGGNSATRDRINKIKNGMMRETMVQLNEAKNPNEFQGIPEPKFKNNNQQQRNNQQKPESTKKVALDAPPQVKSIGEFAGVDDLFDDGGRGSYANDVVMGNEWNNRRQQAERGQIVSEQDIRNTPDFESQFRQKKQSWQDQEQQPIQRNQRQYNEEHNQQPMVGPTQIRNIVEDIADEIVAKKVKQALLEISGMKKQNDNALTYKRVKNKQGQLLNDHIMIDGTIYKLQEVKRK